MQMAKEATAGEIQSNELLRDKTVKDLIADNRRLVEVPYTASLAHTMNALVANRVVAVPVAAPPGHWIGAGGSMIVEADKQTGAVRKHYIGIVTMLDILAHIAGVEVDDGHGSFDVDQRMAVPVSSVIGHCLESLSLWTLNPNTSILDCMEVFSKGIHRALVPLDSHMENISGVELVESASTYRMLTQMDLMKFLKAHDSKLKGIMSRTVSELGAVTLTVFGVTDRTTVIDAIECMRVASLPAVPVVEASSNIAEEHKQLLDESEGIRFLSVRTPNNIIGAQTTALLIPDWRHYLLVHPFVLVYQGKGRKLKGTFSATDLRGCSISQLQSWLSMSVVEFTHKVSASPLHGVASDVGATTTSKQLVTCHADSSIGEVVDKAVTKHVHRVWVVDQQGLLVGLVSLSDLIRAFRALLL